MLTAHSDKSTKNPDSKKKSQHWSSGQLHHHQDFLLHRIETTRIANNIWQQNCTNCLQQRIGIFWVKLTSASIHYRIAFRNRNENVVRTSSLELITELMFFWFYRPLFDKNFNQRTQEWSRLTLDQTEQHLLPLTPQSVVAYNIGSSAAESGDFSATESHCVSLPRVSSGTRAYVTVSTVLPSAAWFDWFENEAETGRFLRTTFQSTRASSSKSRSAPATATTTISFAFATWGASSDFRDLPSTISQYSVSWAKLFPSSLVGWAHLKHFIIGVGFALHEWE